METLKFHYPQLHFTAPQQRSKLYSQMVTCSLRGKQRNPLWRSKRLSNEAIQAIQALKLAKSSPVRLHQVFDTKVSRLIKSDLLDALAVLQNQNELDMALKVFELVKKEVWYKPYLDLYHTMIQLLGKNKLIGKAEELFIELEKEGLKPNTRTFTEMIGAYLQVDMFEKAMELYERMKQAGRDPDKLTFAILIRNLEGAGRQDLADTVKTECGEYMDYPERFLQEIERKHAKRRQVNLARKDSPQSS